MGLLDDFGGSVGGAQGADPLKAILMKKNTCSTNQSLSILG